MWVRVGKWWEEVMGAGLIFESEMIICRVEN
jgi:hypothetical protein